MLLLYLFTIFSLFLCDNHLSQVECGNRTPPPMSAHQAQVRGQCRPMISPGCMAVLFIVSLDKFVPSLQGFPCVYCRWYRRHQPCLAVCISVNALKETLQRRHVLVKGTGSSRGTLTITLQGGCERSQCCRFSLQGFLERLVADPDGQAWLVTGSSRGHLALWDARFAMRVNAWRHPAK